MKPGTRLVGKEVPKAGNTLLELVVFFGNSNAGRKGPRFLDKLGKEVGKARTVN